MPRLAIDYKKACIYEIVCKDVSITQRYVGSTTNLINRRNEHKSRCNNENCKHYNQYVYQFIRANGSFDNWDVVLIEQVIDCKDKEHLHKRERFYIESFKAELNKCIPNRTQKEWCEENKEKIVERMKEYYQDNKEKYNEYYEKNKEKKKEYRREYYEENKNEIAEKQRIYKKEYLANNKNEIAEKQRIYYENNKNEINEKQRINYANKKNLN